MPRQTKLKEGSTLMDYKLSSSTHHIRWILQDECSQFVPHVQIGAVSTGNASSLNGLGLLGNTLQTRKQRETGQAIHPALMDWAF